MDKINNISFTGISNIAQCEFRRTPRTFSKSLSMILKDDFNGKDLTEFKSVINKITDNPAYFKNEDTPNLLNIENFADETGRGLFVNGSLVELNDKNLPMFSYLAKLTKRIAKMPEKEMVVNRDYVEFEAANNLISGHRVSFSDPDDLKLLFDKSEVKTAAQDIKDFIQEVMERYLGI